MDNDDLTDRVGEALSAGIEGVEADLGAPRGDLDDLHARRVRTQRRRAAVVSTMAALLLGGAAVAGWAVSRGDDRIERVTGGTTIEAAETGRIVQGDGDLPRVRPSRGPMDFLQPDAVPDPGSLPSGLLFTRTLEDGSVLEVRGNEYDPSVNDLPPFWDPPDWCFPSGELYVGARFTDSIGRVATHRYDAAPEGEAVGTVEVAGVPEDAPRWLLVAVVPDDAASATAVFPDDSTDEMVAEGGLVLLTAPVAEDYPLDDWFGGASSGTATVVDLRASDGTPLGQSTFTAGIR